MKMIAASCYRGNQQTYMHTYENITANTNTCSHYSFYTVLYSSISQLCISIHRRMKYESKEESVEQITGRGSDVSWLLFLEEKETEAGRGGRQGKQKIEVDSAMQQK